jgi:multiple sugar transport system permease protein
MKRGPKKILVSVVVVLAIVATLFPIAWLFFTSFKPFYEIYHQPPLLVPAHPTLANWDWVFFGGTVYNTYGNSSVSSLVPGNLIIGSQVAFLNSLIVASGSTLLALLVGSPAAYSLARFRTGGQNLGYWILSIRFMPPVTIIFPLFLFFNYFRALDTYPALIFSYIGMNLPFVIWTLAAFFEEVPSEIDDAAMIDGAGRLEILMRFIIPMSIPAIAATAIFTFILGWNELLIALILTRHAALTLPVTLQAWNLGTTGLIYGPLSAMALLAVTPGLVLAFYLQKYLVRGLTMGAVKG